MAPENSIPSIDLSPVDLSPLMGGSACERREVARQIGAACTDIGFFMVVGHGVPRDLITDTRDRAIEFFAWPDAEKMKVQRPPAKISRGYNWVGDRAVSYSMGQPAPPDIQEAFTFGPEGVAALAAQAAETCGRMYAPNIWPARPHDFQETMVRYHAAMSALSLRVLRAMATALGIDEDYFVDKFDRRASVARIIRYPAIAQTPLPRQLRAGAHTDYG